MCDSEFGVLLLRFVVGRCVFVGIVFDYGVYADSSFLVFKICGVLLIVVVLGWVLGCVVILIELHFGRLFGFVIWVCIPFITCWFTVFARGCFL